MKKFVNTDILEGIFLMAEKYMILQEFSGTKISSYEKAIYNAMKKAIHKDKKHELFE